MVGDGASSHKINYVGKLKEILNLEGHQDCIIGSRAELLKRTDTRTHVRAKFSRICAKFKLLNAELAKQALFHIFGTI